MPLLLEDLAEEAANSNRRAAERLDEEVRALDELRRTLRALDELRQTVIERAREATEFAITRLPTAEAAWRSGLAALRKVPTAAGATLLLERLLHLLQSGLTLVRSVHPFWEIAAQLGAEPERSHELAGAERRFEELAADVRKAIEHRATQRQVAEPDRLAKGLELAREGKTIKADEARARYGRSQG
jgi:hypothetical protein